MDRSSQNEIRRLWIGAGYALAVAIIVVSLIPSPPVDMQAGRDKVYHAIAYCLLMWWFVQAYSRQSWFTIALACSTLGIVLEYAQRLTGYRSFSYEDMAANIIGVIVAWILAWLGLRNTTNWIATRWRRASCNSD